MFHFKLICEIELESEGAVLEIETVEEKERDNNFFQSREGYRQSLQFNCVNETQRWGES